ncbi:MAG: PAS domain-containing protein [Rhizomicrobium sp.]
MPHLHDVETPDFSVTGQATVVEIAPRDVESQDIRDVLAVWNARRGAHAMPTREDVLPRPLGRLLRNVSLVKVIDGGADYEFRVVGDVHVQAYGVNSQGTRISELIASPTWSQFGDVLKRSYDLVRLRRAPVGFRGSIRREVAQARFDWAETLYMPLRNAADEVEYILNASVYRPRDGIWPGKYVLG